ncbi:MAG: 16S rRNA (guanine(527)-N(7))-methyltransferase RsmG [Alphaproteobacteria bacterium]
MNPPEDVLKKISEIIQKDVSRETLLKFDVYLNLLFSENEKYNLIGKKEKEFVWHRHVLDSVQIYPFLLSKKSIIDLGAGAGFPGVPLSFLGTPNITLVDSSEKKTNFLKIVSRETNQDFKVVCKRVEQIKNLRFDVGISRALAPLSKILEWCQEMCGELVLLKGRSYQAEIDEAKKTFSFECEVFSSITSDESKILRIKKLRKKLE